MEKKQIQVGQVYSARCGGAWLSVRIDKSLWHGRYEGTSLPSGKVVKTCTDAIRGDGQSEEQWKANRAPKTHDLPVPPPTATAKAGKSKPTGKKKDHSLSGLNAAAKVLADVGKPMNCTDIVERMIETSLWKTSGKTPWATLHAAISREITTKGKASRFKKAGKGLFTLSGK